MAPLPGLSVREPDAVKGCAVSTAATADLALLARKLPRVEHKAFVMPRQQLRVMATRPTSNADEFCAMREHAPPCWMNQTEGSCR